MPDIRFLSKVSRPRFWLYLFGPYIVGLAAAASTREELLRWDVLLFGLYFLIPANLLIYGINDIFDFETDRLNPKKAEYEMLVRPESHRGLAVVIIILNLPFVIAAFFLTPQALPALAGFIFFSVFYSAPPLRAKSLPIIDSVFNVLYVFPGVFAYQMLTGEFPPLTVLAAAWLWTMAMHAFSAIPDIRADHAAGVSTVATFLGRSGTLAFCFFAYLISAALAWQYLGNFSLAMAAVYAFMIAMSSVSRKDEAIFTIYKYFPLLNAAVGFALFWITALNKFL